jgi:DNA-binding response OmpR family regulator
MASSDSTLEPTPVVLVVDDDPDLVDLLSRFLSRHGMVALPAYSGQQCLERVDQSPTIDVIVLDVMMPEMDGLEVCTILRQSERSRTIPIILLTARDDLETRLAGVRLGVSDFVVKPASGQDLVSRIRTLVDARRKGQQMEDALASTAPPAPKTRT